MPWCAAINCRNSDCFENRQKGITFHSFPFSKKEVLQKWIINMRRVEPDGRPWAPTKHTRLCSEHFTPECFDRTGQTTRLREGAVPTVFKFEDHLQIRLPAFSRRTETTKKAPAMIDPPSASTPSASGFSCITREHDYALLHSPKRQKRRLDEVRIKEEPQTDDYD